MKVFFITLFLACSFPLAANDSSRNSITFKGGYPYGRGVYFGASYSYRINKLLRIAPTVSYANTLLDDEVFVAANVNGIYGQYGEPPVYTNGRITSALTLDVQFSSHSFTAPDCRHHVLLGIGFGILHYIWTTTTYGQNSQGPPHWSSMVISNGSMNFAQHASLSYGYRVGKRVELGIFGDALLYPADADSGVGLYCSLSF